MKKCLLLALALLSLFWLNAKNDSKDPFCAFCDGDVVERQTFYSGDKVLGILTHKPAVPGHVLIIPKRHVERFEQLSPEELVEMHEAIRLINLAEERLYRTANYLLLQKNGVEAGQSVPHVHFHYLPRSKMGGHFLFITRFFISTWLKPISAEKMERVRQELKSEIDQILNELDFEHVSSQRFLMKTLDRHSKRGIIEMLPLAYLV